MDRNGNGSGGAGTASLLKMGHSADDLPPYVHLELTVDDVDTICAALKSDVPTAVQ